MWPAASPKSVEAPSTYPFHRYEDAPNFDASPTTMLAKPIGASHGGTSFAKTIESNTIVAFWLSKSYKSRGIVIISVSPGLRTLNGAGNV